MWMWSGSLKMPHCVVLTRRLVMMWGGVRPTWQRQGGECWEVPFGCHEGDQPKPCGPRTVHRITRIATQ